MHIEEIDRSAWDEQVLLERVEENIVLVTLNRPQAYNAVTPQMTAAIKAIVDTVEADDTVRVAVLTAAGEKAFCAGADLNAIAKGKGGSVVSRSHGFAGFTSAQRSKPWIAAVRGHVVGGGLEIMLACDMAVAGQSVRLALPEVKRARVPGAGGGYRLPLAIPRMIAVEMLLTGEPIYAERAFQIGLVNRVVSDANIVGEALQLATRIATNGPLAIRETLKLARQAYAARDEELRALATQAYLCIRDSEDAKEGSVAFVEKRMAVYVGR